MFAIFNSRKWFWHSGTRTFCPDAYFFNSFAEVEMEIKMAKRQDFTADILAFTDSMPMDEVLKYIDKMEITNDTIQTLKEIHSMMGLDSPSNQGS